MPDLKFGLLPGSVPVGLKDLTYYIAGNLPSSPAKCPVPQPQPQSDGTPWGVEGNDEYGNCGVAGVDHSFMCDDAILALNGQFPSRQDVIDYYLTYTGGQDTGVVLSDFLSYVRKNGFFSHTLKAYAPVAVHDIPTLHFAVWTYGNAYTGIKVTQAMMDGFQAGKPWDLDDMLSEVVGGHCIPIVGYDSQYLYAVTWGKVQPISYSAWHFMSSEAWALITGEFTAKGGDGRGVNLAALEADLNKLAA